MVAALDNGDAFRSRVSVYLHPLGGRPIIWHVVRALADTTPPPDEIRILHRASATMSLPSPQNVPLIEEVVDNATDLRSLRAAITSTGTKVLIDGAAPMITPATIALMLRAAETGVVALLAQRGDDPPLAVAGEGPALASADDPRRPLGPNRITPASPEEVIRVSDRQSLSEASVALRDRLVNIHEERGVSFLLPATSWMDVDVRIGADTLVYPGVVLEGLTEIGSECVIGPHCRVIEATIGRGVELKGWNYVTRTSIRNQAVLEPYVRRGFD